MTQKNIFPPAKQSIKILSLVKKYIAKPNYSGLFGISVRKGKGCYFTDFDGFRYLDCMAGASVNCIGFGNSKIVKAYSQNAKKMHHSAFIYSPNMPAIQLAKKLIEITPGKFEKKVAFGLSGSDACDGAIKAMRRYTGIAGIIHFKNDYHGSTGLSMPASDFGHLNDKVFKKDNLFIELDYPKNQTQSNKVIEQIELAFVEKKAGGILLETIQGDAGVNMPPTGFLQSIAQLCKKYNTVFIADEVQSGMGRTGKWWAIEHQQVEPDIIVTGKALSGGYAPVSAIIGKTLILDTLNPAQHVFTYSGHAPSCAAALEVIKFIEKHNLLNNACQMGLYLTNGLNKLTLKYPSVITQVRSQGLMTGIEINIEKNHILGKILATRCVELGVYIGFFGVNAQVLRVEPPIIINKKDIDIIISVLDNVIDEYINGKTPEKTISNVKKYSMGL